MRSKPATSKGKYLKKMTVSSTMGVGIPLILMNLCVHLVRGIAMNRQQKESVVEVI